MESPNILSKPQRKGKADVCNLEYVVSIPATGSEGQGAERSWGECCLWSLVCNMVCQVMCTCARDAEPPKSKKRAIVDSRYAVCVTKAHGTYKCQKSSLPVCWIEAWCPACSQSAEDPVYEDHPHPEALVSSSPSSLC